MGPCGLNGKIVCNGFCLFILTLIFMIVFTFCSLKEEYSRLIEYIKINKELGSDWFRIESNKTGNRYDIVSSDWFRIESNKTGNRYDIASSDWFCIESNKTGNRYGIASSDWFCIESTYHPLGMLYRSSYHLLGMLY